MLWYSAFSLPWPMYSFVATLNCVTALPEARLRISGSRVRRPVNRTLFTVRTPSRSTGWPGSTLRSWRDEAQPTKRRLRATQLRMHRPLFAVGRHDASRGDPFEMPGGRSPLRLHNVTYWSRVGTFD